MLKSDFTNITDSLVLNYCNTKVIKHGKLIDLFDSVTAFEQWLEMPMDKNEAYNRQLSVMYSCLEDDVTINELIDLREELKTLLFKIEKDQNVIDSLKSDIELFMSHNPFSLIFVENSPLLVPLKKGINGIKTILFLSLVELIETGELKKITKCADETCQLFFINTSGRRKWCSMKSCGNRNKVDNFISRNKKE